MERPTQDGALRCVLSNVLKVELYRAVTKLLLHLRPGNGAALALRPQLLLERLGLTARTTTTTRLVVVFGGVGGGGGGNGGGGVKNDDNENDDDCDERKLRDKVTRGNADANPSYLGPSLLPRRAHRLELG